MRIYFSYSSEKTGKMYNETCCRQNGVPEDCMRLCENPDGCCSKETLSGYFIPYNKFALDTNSICLEYKTIIRETCVIEKEEKTGIVPILVSQ